MPNIAFIPPPISFHDPGRDLAAPILHNAYALADTLMTRVPQLRMQQQALDAQHAEQMGRLGLAREEAELQQRRFDAEHALRMQQLEETQRKNLFDAYPFLQGASFGSTQQYNKAVEAGRMAWQNALRAAQQARQDAATTISRRVSEPTERDDASGSMVQTATIKTFVPGSPAGQALMAKAQAALERIKAGTGSTSDYALVHELSGYLPQRPSFDVTDALLARFGGLTPEQLETLVQSDQARLTSLLGDPRVTVLGQAIEPWRSVRILPPPLTLPDLRMQDAAPDHGASVPGSSPPGSPPHVIPPSYSTESEQRDRALAWAQPRASTKPASDPQSQGSNAPLQRDVTKVLEQAYEEQLKQVDPIIDALLQGKSWLGFPNKMALQQAGSLRDVLVQQALITKDAKRRQALIEAADRLSAAATAHLNSRSEHARGRYEVLLSQPDQLPWRQDLRRYRPEDFTHLFSSSANP